MFMSVSFIGLCSFYCLAIIGRDVLPKVNSGTFQVRLRGPDGTRLERTEATTIKALHILETLVGKENIAITSSMVGTHPVIRSPQIPFTYLWPARRKR